MSAIVYRAFDADGALLYIGMTSDLTSRLKNHRSTKPWWDAVARVESSAPMHWATATANERDAIRAEQPKYNVAAKYGMEAHEIARACKAAQELAALRTPSNHRRFRQSDVEALLQGAA